MQKKNLCIALAALPFIACTPCFATETIIYTYDAQGRLTQVKHTGTVNNNVQSDYTFDNADNRTIVTVTNANSRVIVVPINGLTVIPIPDP